MRRVVGDATASHKTRASQSRNTVLALGQPRGSKICSAEGGYKVRVLISKVLAEAAVWKALLNDTDSINNSSGYDLAFCNIPIKKTVALLHVRLDAANELRDCRVDGGHQS